MNTPPTAPAPTTPLTKALAVGVFACVGVGLGAVLTGVSPSLAGAALAASAVLAITAAVLEYRRAPQNFPVGMRSPFEAVPGELTPPRSEGESWLAADAAYMTSIARMALLTYAFPVVILLLWACVRNDITGPNLPAGARALGRLLEIMMGVLFLISVLGAVFMQRAAKRVRHKRIGADPTHLLYDPGTGKIERYEWSSVLTDKFALLTGRRVLTLVRPSGLRQTTMFPAEGVRTLILARLPPASFVGHARLQWSALCRGNPSLWAACGILLCMFVLQLLKKLHPEWFNAATSLLLEWLRALG